MLPSATCIFNRCARELRVAANPCAPFAVLSCCCEILASSSGILSGLSSMIAGFANPEGTARYRQRFGSLRDAGFFRELTHVSGADGLWLPSLGAGTYLGEASAEADADYTAAISQALRRGINLIDSAINYRHQRSERSVGAALQHAVAHSEVQREEIMVCTKAGFLTFDGEAPPDPQAYFIENYINRSIVRPGEIAGGMHCMAPKYLEDQLERSRRNLKLETIDVFYVHNPESQLGAGVERGDFRKRLREAFAALERTVEAYKIRFYGCATWNAFRVAPQQRDYMSLEEVTTIAREVGGDRHHCRFIQLPFNLAMPEAFTSQNQPWQGEMLSVFEAARRAQMAVIGSATLYQARLMQNLPEKIRKKLGSSSDLEAAIQFARSAPGITTSLIGMSKTEHVAANLKAASAPVVAQEDWLRLFQE